MKKELTLDAKKLKRIKGYLLMRKEELADYKKYAFNKDGYYNIKIEEFFDYILKIIEDKE